MMKTAVIPRCDLYRYELTRAWGFQSTCVFVGLNPSTADAEIDDNTIRRCIGFAKSWGHGRLVMLNAYAFRATKPKDMKAALDPVGPNNDEYLKRWKNDASVIVAAWGTNITWGRETAVKEIFGDKLHYLKLTVDGHPGHPLYLENWRKPILWD